MHYTHIFFSSIPNSLTTTIGISVDLFAKVLRCFNSFCFYFISFQIWEPTISYLIVSFLVVIVFFIRPSFITYVTILYIFIKYYNLFPSFFSSLYIDFLQFSKIKIFIFGVFFWFFGFYKPEIRKKRIWTFTNNLEGYCSTY